MTIFLKQQRTVGKNSKNVSHIQEILAWLERQAKVTADPAASASSADEGGREEDTHNAISEAQDESTFQKRFAGLSYPIALQ